MMIDHSRRQYPRGRNATTGGGGCLSSLCPRSAYVFRQLRKSLSVVVGEARQGDAASVFILAFLALSAVYAAVWCGSVGIAAHRVAGTAISAPMPTDAEEIRERIAAFARRSGVGGALRERAERERVWQWPWNGSALDVSDRATQLRAVTAEIEMARTASELGTVLRVAQPLLRESSGASELNRTASARRFWTFANELRRVSALQAKLREEAGDEEAAAADGSRAGVQARHAAGERRAAAHCLRNRYRRGVDRASGLLIVLLGSVAPPARRHDVRSNGSVLSVDEVRGVCEWERDQLRAEGAALLDKLSNSSWVALAAGLRARRRNATRAAKQANASVADDPSLAASLPREEELLWWRMEWEMLSPLAQLLFASGKLTPDQAARFTPDQVRVSASMELAATSKAPHKVGMKELNNLTLSALEAKASGAVDAADSIFDRYVFYRQNVSALCSAAQPRDVATRRFLASVGRTDVLMKSCRSINQAFRLELLKRSASKINVWMIPKITDVDELTELCAFYALPPFRRLLAASGVNHELITSSADVRNTAIDAASKVRCGAHTPREMCSRSASHALLPTHLSLSFSLSLSLSLFLFAGNGGEDEAH